MKKSNRHNGCTHHLLFMVMLIWPCFASAQDNYAKDNGWYFDNFETLLFPWSTYQATFIGVPENSSAPMSLFDELFYDNLYKTLGEPGNCYGMALLSLMMTEYGSHHGFCGPVASYSGDDNGPSDSNLELLINQMHGYQLNLETVRHTLTIFGEVNSRKGMHAYDQLNILAEPAIVTITKAQSPQAGGHAMVAYATGDRAGGKKCIYVYDPSRPYPLYQEWYDDDYNIILIDPDPTKNSWEFEMESGSTWSGKPGGGNDDGHIMIIPLRVTGIRGRSPASLSPVVAVSEFLTTIFLSGEGSTLKQISDADGKKLFKPGTMQLDMDPTSGLRNTIPWYPSDVAPSQSQSGLLNYAVYFQFGSPASRMDFDISGGEDGYRLQVMGPSSLITVKSSGGKVRDLVSIKAAGSKSPGVILSNPRSSTSNIYEIEFGNLIQGAEKVHMFKVSNLRLQPRGEVVLDIVQNQKSIRVASPKKSVSYDLQFKYVAANIERPDTVLIRKIQVLPGESMEVSPSDWENIQRGDIKTKVRKEGS